MALEPITHQTIIPASPRRVFEVFCALGVWWPLAYTFSEARFEDGAVERRKGGRWYERDVEGKETEWGDVRAYDEGQRLVLGWGIGADRRPVPLEEASEVELRFEPVQGGARVTIEHRAFERHGDSGATLRTGMSSPQGWPLILAELRRTIRHVERSRVERPGPG
jgi:uncharacterized protein YndB with AHSA1/START domain